MFSDKPLDRVTFPDQNVLPLEGVMRDWSNHGPTLETDRGDVFLSWYAIHSIQRVSDLPAGEV
jgi:hypothetical protein